MWSLKLAALPALLLCAGFLLSTPDLGSSRKPMLGLLPSHDCGIDETPNPPNKDVIIDIPKTNTVQINDIHIEYEPTDAGVTKTLLTDGTLAETPLNGWHLQDDGQGSINGRMPSKKGNQPIGPNQGAGLIIKSLKNLTKLSYTLTANGHTKRVQLALISPDPVMVTTCNQFPSTTGALFEFENQTGEPLSELQVSPQSQQQIIELGSQSPGFPVLEEGRFVFDPPVESGEWSTIYWTYDDFGPDPDVDTQVILTPTFLGFLVEPLAVTTGPGQKQGRVKVLKANGQNQVLPPLKVEECRAGGLPQTLVIKCDANMSFVAGTATARVSVGDLTVAAKPKVQAGGRELVLSIGRSRSKTKGTLMVYGIQVHLVKGAFGGLRIFVPVGNTWRAVQVGVVR